MVLEPYHKPTQVGERKSAKVNEWKLLKELGKKASVSSQYGFPAFSGTQLKYPWRLFIKNISLC